MPSVSKHLKNNIYLSELCMLMYESTSSCAGLYRKVLTFESLLSSDIRIKLHSSLPDGAINDMRAALNARGSLKREPQGVIRTCEITQLHLV